MVHYLGAQSSHIFTQYMSYIFSFSQLEDRSAILAAPGAEGFRGFGAAPVWPFRGPSPSHPPCAMRTVAPWPRGPGTSHFGTWTGPAKAVTFFNHFLFFFGCHMLPLKYRLNGDSVENDVCGFHGVGLKSICIYLFISS